MEETTFEKKLADLIDELKHMPKLSDSGPLFLARRNKAYQHKLSKTADNLQDSVDFLRLSVKYLLFDLEATRRENAYLRRLIDDGE
jgi:hypothetical protein